MITLSAQAMRNTMRRKGYGAAERLPPLLLQEGATVQSQVYAILRQSLMSGQFRPGEEISLRQAASALGTSVTPVREALRQLESEGGLVVHGKNRTLRVPVIPPEDLREIGDIRIQLEGLAAGEAASRIGSSQLRLVRNAVDLMGKAAEAGDADMYLAQNWRFHSLIYRTVERPILVGIIEGLWMRVGPVVRLALDAPGHVALSMACHREAEEALRRRDGPAARAAIERDIRTAADDLAEALDRRMTADGGKA